MPDHDDGNDDERALWRRRGAAGPKPVAADSACPDEGTLAAFLDGRTGAGERERLEAHLAACPSCLAATLEASHIEQLPPAPVSGEQLARWTRTVVTGQRGSMRLPARLAIAAALLLTCGGGFLLGARAMRDVAVLTAAGGGSPFHPFSVVSAP